MKQILFSILFLSTSLTLSAHAADTQRIKDFKNILEDVLSESDLFDFVIREPEIDDLTETECKLTSGTKALSFLLKNVLYIESADLTKTEKEGLKTFYNTQNDYLTCVKSQKARSDHYHFSTNVIIVDYTTKEQLAIDLNWIDGNPTDEP
ncbi:MAG: hypothetical protein KDD34_03985, partial [Bdellovibrionales bacterium]|nr:hypothetical protein [Bdellovibrionales bacterium]